MPPAEPMPAIGRPDGNGSGADGPRTRPLDFAALAELEPRLFEVEARARAIRDDGSASFFCSNYLWLPVQGDLKRVVGVDRRGAPDEPEEGPLWDSSSFEVAYRHISGQLPKCRNCGCRVFEPYRGTNAGESATSGSLPSG